MKDLGPILTELSGFEIFKKIPKQKLAELVKNSEVVLSEHRDLLYRAGSAASFFGVVLSGAYKLSKLSLSGEDVIVHFSTPGDVLAAFVMAHPNPHYPVSATAMGPSRFLKIPRSNYLEIWKSEPELIFQIQNLLSTRMNILQDQKALQKASLAQKLAALILSLVDKKSDDLSLSIPLTRKEIAENLGASVESIIRIMSDWSKLGIIQTNEQQIKILKPEKVVSFLNPS